MIGIIYGYCVKHGGIGRYISEYFKNLSQPSNFELLTIEKNIEMPDEIKTTIIDCERDTRFMSIAENKRFSSFVRKLSEKYDITHSHGVYEFIPGIYTAHICLNSYFDRFIEFFGKSKLPEPLKDNFEELTDLENKIISTRDGKRLVTVSHKVANELSKKYGCNKNNIEVIHGASRFSQNKCEYMPSTDKNDAYTIGFIGGNLYTKGILFIKDVISELVSREFNITCVGAGCDDTIGNYLKDSRCETKTLGKCDINESFYKSLDIFLNLSIYEAYSLTTLEAMSLGIPVISSDLNGVFYDAKEDLELGRVRDITNSKEVANIIEKILYDDDFRDRVITSGYKIVQENSWKCVSLRYEKIYQEFL